MTTPILTPDREERRFKTKSSAPVVRAAPNRVVEALQAAAREVGSRMAETAGTTRDRAIEHVRRLGPETWREAPLAKLTHEPGFLTPFKLGLAAQCARVLAASEPRVLSAFTYDLADHMIHLLLLVDETSEDWRASPESSTVCSRPPSTSCVCRIATSAPRCSMCIR